MLSCELDANYIVDLQGLRQQSEKQVMQISFDPVHALIAILLFTDSTALSYTLIYSNESTD